MAQKPLEQMTCCDVVEWLASVKAQKFNQEVFDAIQDNDLDGEALAAALDHGPEALKEAIPSLGKRLKLIRVLKTIPLQEQQTGSSTSARSTPTLSQSFFKSPLSSTSFDVSSPASQDLDCTESAYDSLTDDISFTKHVPVCNSEGVHRKDVHTPTVSSNYDSSGDETSTKSLILTPKTSGAGKCDRRKIIDNNLASTMAVTMEKFSVPTFRVATEKNLQEKTITDKDRKYIVRTLATILISYVPHPTMGDCGVAAKALVAKYPFLADTVGKPHFSWMKFISTRCSNVNRGNSVEPQPKKMKLDRIAKHDYPQVSPCDDVSYERNMDRMAKELGKTKPNHDVLVDLMQQTFPNRREWVISEGHHVSVICDKFPLLKSPGHIGKEFEMVVEQPGCQVKFKEAWLSQWTPGILKIAKADGIKVTDEDEPEGIDELPEEFLTQAAFRALVKLIVPPRKVKVSMPLERLLLSVKKGTPYEEIRPPTSHPVIVILRDIDDASQDRFYIMIEQEMLHDTPDFTHALFILLAVHYVFNLEYDTHVQEPLLFLQEFVAGIKDTSLKHSAFFSSVTSRITRQL